MWLYVWFLKFAALFNAKARKLVDGEKKTISLLRQTVNQSDNYIWFHAASVGEFEQARPIIERLKNEQYGGQSTKILLTFFSPSGYEMRKDYKFADIVAYLPFATKRNAKLFLDIVRPQKAIFVKYEFWPAYLRELGKRGVETYIISSIFRPNQLFFKWYGGWYRRLLNCFTTLFVQDQESEELLARYSINNVVVAGDTRFDRVAQIAAQASTNDLIERFAGEKDMPLLIAGSSWQPDEELLVKYFFSHPRMRLLIVPHELTTSHLDQLASQLGDNAVFFSRASEQTVGQYRCMVLDTMGMLSVCYRYAQVAYVGGGFGVGIHNTLEPAVYSLPVVFGPNYGKFREAKEMIACGGAFSISNYAELEAVLDNVLYHPEQAARKAGQYVKDNQGAVDKIYASIF